MYSSFSCQGLMHSVRSNSFCTSPIISCLRSGTTHLLGIKNNKFQEALILTQYNWSNMQKAAYSSLQQHQKINYSPFFSFASLRCWNQHWLLVQQVGQQVLLLLELQGERVGTPRDVGALVLKTFLGPQLLKVAP